jgi:2-aminoethylphosphonate transport system ATP-binding protein
VGNSNLLPVTVAQCRPHPDGSFRARVRIAEDADLVTATCAEAATAGAQRTLCLRPHFLGLAAAEHHDNAFAGTVTEVQWRGSSHRIFAEVHGHEVRLDTTELRNPPVIGDAVWLHFSAEDAVLIPAAASGSAGAAAASATTTAAPAAEPPAQALAEPAESLAPLLTATSTSTSTDGAAR